MNNITVSKSYKLKISGALITVTVDSSCDSQKIKQVDAESVRWLHYHAMHELFFVGKNPLVLVTEKGSESFSESVLFVPSYLKHMALRGAGYRVLFSCENLSAAGDYGRFMESICSSKLPVTVRLGASVEFYLKEFTELFFSGADAVADDMATSLLKLIFYGIYRDNAESLAAELSPTEESYLVKIDSIIGDYKRDITLGYVAEQLGLSTRQTARILNARYKSTLTELVTQQRLGVARRLIEENELSVAEIVEYVNFSSQSQFAKKFKEAFGITPNAYKQSLKKNKKI